MRSTFVTTVMVVSVVGVGLARGGDIQPGGPVKRAVSPSSPTIRVASRDLATTAAAGLPARRALREVTIPTGTVLPLRLETPIGSATSRVEDQVHATLRRSIRVGTSTVIPAGAQLVGSVVQSRRAGKVKGRSYIAVRFHTLVAGNERYTVRTTSAGARGVETKKEDAAKIGIPAAGGAIVGGIVGGKKGAAIGGAAGGGAGTAVVLNTRGKDVRLGRGAALSVRLAAPVTVKVG
jgi:hypothetical protein